MLKIGDKVRFLNAVGGGIVKGFQSKEIALVEEEDGFEIPVLIRECVVVETTNLKVNPENNLPQIPPKTPSFNPIIVREKASESSYQYDTTETPEGEFLTVELAFIPTDILQLQTCDYDAYLINDSNYFLRYHLFSVENKSAKILHQGEIEPHTQYHFMTVKKEELNLLENIVFQAIAFKQTKFSLKPNFDVRIKNNVVKFYKRHSFVENDYFSQEALIFSLIKNDVVTKDFSFSSTELQEAMTTKKENVSKNIFQKQPKKKQSETSKVLEIDLHIHALLDSVVGMDSKAILDYQLSIFRQVMNENLKQKGKKIVFIHGKGEGVLRAEIIKELKKRYSNCYVQDASFREYGFGATMVTIR